MELYTHGTEPKKVVIFGKENPDRRMLAGADPGEVDWVASHPPLGVQCQ